MGKNALKNKKKQERKQKNEAKDKAQETATVKVEVNYVSDLVLKLTGDAEVDKQLKDLKKVTQFVNICLLTSTFLTCTLLFFQKLDQIGKLKLEKAAGKTMELNQLDKMTKEQELRAEFDKLTVN